MVRAKNTTHGMSQTPTYQTWQAMCRRCRDPNFIVYADYGGRGITVCRRWANSFEAFLEDMSERPSKRHSIERIDNARGYEPGNCRWATQTEQMRNTRASKFLTHEGATRTMAEWAECAGISYGALQCRISQGWSVTEALTTPVRPMRR